MATHDRWIQHPGGRIFTRTWTPGAARDGNAAPVVLLHDSLGCVDLWRDFPARLSQTLGREVIAYDRLGFGRSDARPARPSLDFIAEEAPEYFACVQDQLALERLVVMGHSVGGGMGIHAAAQLGARCEALVTISAQVFAEDRTLEGIRAAREVFRDPKQRERLARYHGDKTDWVLDAWIENWLDPGFAAWSVADVLPQVRSPALALHGELDEYGTTRHPELIAQLCGGGGEARILAGIGHVPHREQPDMVLGLIQSFLG